MVMAVINTGTDIHEGALNRNTWIIVYVQAPLGCGCSGFSLNRVPNPGDFRKSKGMQDAVIYFTTRIGWISFTCKPPAPFTFKRNCWQVFGWNNFSFT